MSSTLMWRPVAGGDDCPDKLKFLLRKKYGDPIDAVLDVFDLDYLRGVHDAGVEGADVLIKAIEAHGRIRLFEQW